MRVHFLPHKLAGIQIFNAVLLTPTNLPLHDTHYHKCCKIADLPLTLNIMRLQISLSPLSFIPSVWLFSPSTSSVSLPNQPFFNVNLVFFFCYCMSLISNLSYPPICLLTLKSVWSVVILRRQPFLRSCRLFSELFNCMSLCAPVCVT